MSSDKKSTHSEVGEDSRELLLKCLSQLKSLTEPETELATVYNNFARVISTLTPTKPVVDWKQLREEYFSECCEIKPSSYVPPPMDVPTSMKRVALAPHDLFEWFKTKLKG